MKNEKENAEEKKNAPFVQLSVATMPKFREIVSENSLAANIMLFLAQHMSHENIVICSQAVLIEEFDCSRTTLYRALKYLVEKKLVIVVKFGTANGYGVNGEFFWKTYNKRDKYMVFDNVKALASKSENKKLKAKLVHLFEKKKEQICQADLFDEDGVIL